MIESRLLEDLAVANRIYPNSSEQYFAITYDADDSTRAAIQDLTMDIEEAIKAYDNLDLQSRNPRLYSTNLVFTDWNEYNPEVAYNDGEEELDEVDSGAVATA